MAAEAENQITAKERYAQLERDRNVVLDRAQRAAKLLSKVIVSRRRERARAKNEAERKSWTWDW